MNYSEASAKLGNRDRRKLANNTYLEKREGGAVALRYHSTDVVTFHRDGRTVLTSGGWFTSTTKERIGYAVPVHQQRGQWFVTVRGKVYPFADGMTIGKRGGVRGAGKAPKADKWRDKVSAYADKFVERLMAGKIPAPSGGDCWHCAMLTEGGQTLGDATGSDHIRQHVKESYFVPSMLNAIAPRLSMIARADVGALMGLHDQKPFDPAWTKRQVRSALRRYIGEHTGVALR